MKFIRKNILTIALILAFSTFLVGYIANNHKQYTDWVSTRAVVEITVAYGDTLTDYAVAYKPAWMNIQEYCYELKELNNMTDSMLYAGQNFKVYVSCTHYTVEGLCLDEYIVTTDGNEWLYDTDIRGCVSVTFSDNGTADIFDDVIINITKIG